MENKIQQKQNVLRFLEEAYSDAKTMDDVELMIRLSRAIVAFNYDTTKTLPDWNEMQQAYFNN